MNQSYRPPTLSFFSSVCFSIVIRKATSSRTSQMPPPGESVSLQTYLLTDRVVPF